MIVLDDAPNLAVSTLAAELASGATTAQITNPALFPAPTTAYNASVFGAAYDSPQEDTTTEIVRITAKPANYTVARAQEGTSQKTWAAGSKILVGFTKKAATDLDNNVSRLTGIVGMMESGATGDGVASDKTAFEAAIVVATVTGGRVRLEPGTYLIDGNTTITDTDVTFEFERGAKIKIDDSVALTFPSPNHIQAADNQQIFDDDNTEHDGVRFTEGGRMSVGWWGAADGGSITNPMQSALVGVNSAGKGEIVIPAGDYTFTDYDNTVTSPECNYMVYESDGVKISGYGAKITYTTGETDREPFIRLWDTKHTIIEGMHIDGAVAQTTNGYLLHIQSADYTTIRNVRLENAHMDCLVIADNGADGTCFHGSIIDSYFGAGQRDCVAFDNAVGWTVENCTITAAAQTAYRQANYIGLVFESHSAGDLIQNITFRNCRITNCYGPCVRLTDNNGAIKDIRFENCFIEVDEDGTSNATAIALDSDAENFVFDTCRIRGNTTISGQASFFNCTFLIDDDITTGAGSALYPLYFTADATHGCVVENCRFDLASGTYNPRFVVFYNRSGNSEGVTFVFRNNTFTTNGANLGSTNYFDLGNPHSDDNFIFDGNRFRHVTPNPATAYYCNLREDLPQCHFTSSNHFCDYLRLGSTTGANGRYSNGEVHLIDGITEPSQVSARARAFVHTTDGDHKIKFADGFVATIVADS